jgi:hypothetical protein
MDAFTLIPLVLIAVLFFLACHFLDRLNPVHLDEQDDISEDILNPGYGLQVMPAWCRSDESLPAVA